MSLRATSVTPKSLAARPCCGADDSAAARWGVNLTWRRYGRAILIADCIAPLAGVGSALEYVSESACQDVSSVIQSPSGFLAFEPSNISPIGLGGQKMWSEGSWNVL